MVEYVVLYCIHAVIDELNMTTAWSSALVSLHIHTARSERRLMMCACVCVWLWLWEWGAARWQACILCTITLHRAPGTFAASNGYQCFACSDIAPKRLSFTLECCHITAIANPIPDWAPHCKSIVSLHPVRQPPIRPLSITLTHRPNKHKIEKKKIYI